MGVAWLFYFQKLQKFSVLIWPKVNMDIDTAQCPSLIWTH